MKVILFPRLLLGTGFLVGIILGVKFIQAIPTTNATPASQPVSLEEKRDAITRAYRPRINDALERGDKTEATRLNQEMLEKSDNLIARPSNERQAAMESIRAFRENKDLNLNYIVTSPNPYLENSDQKIEIYQDAEGMSYYIDRSTGHVIQMEVSPETIINGEKMTTPLAIDYSARYTPKELEQVAISFLERRIENYPDAVKAAKYNMSDKEKTVYFFRWDLPGTPTAPMRFLQVGMTTAGQIVQFTNSLQY